MKEIKGAKTLRALGKYENKCERGTEKLLPRMGKKAPLCYEYLSQLLVHAEFIGTCVYSCPGKKEDHTLWYLAVRASSLGRAALRLMKLGFYDEALIIVRSLGEITNLFSMFFLMPETIEEWKKSDRKYRLNELTPGKIRKRIEAFGKTPAIGFERYVALCEVGTHPVPDLRPQKFNHAGKSLTGGFALQEAGVLVVLNEMAYALPLLVVLAAAVCKVPKEAVSKIKEVSLKCLKAGGGIDLQNVGEVLERMGKAAPSA
jgi:hypothetical protein